MDLKEFVAQTLVQIVAGVDDATRRIAEMGTNARVNPRTIRQPDDAEARQTQVEFDVAVTVVEQEDATSHDTIGAAAGFLSVVSAKITGESGNQTIERQRNETVSRVRFAISIAQPAQIDDRTDQARAADVRRRDRADTVRRTIA